ncbi:MAG: LAP1C-like protein [Pacific salmon nidovirus]|uniref:LAP1C-like protein n=1 Tax=Pacific salmon nidovirus TaxID=2587487 RepID=A0AAE6M6A5_9NIDO|nr:MAG: LAP1C-like protein [Pacific salmon nidovirus]QEG08238.1 MAG: LAP1C-like protein [Pacific salmon nidovirus]
MCSVTVLVSLLIVLSAVSSDSSPCCTYKHMRNHVIERDQAVCQIDNDVPCLADCTIHYGCCKYGKPDPACLTTQLLLAVQCSNSFLQELTQHTRSTECMDTPVTKGADKLTSQPPPTTSDIGLLQSATSYISSIFTTDEETPSPQTPKLPTTPALHTTNSEFTPEDLVRAANEFFGVDDNGLLKSTTEPDSTESPTTSTEPQMSTSVEIVADVAPVVIITTSTPTTTMASLSSSVPTPTTVASPPVITTSVIDTLIAATPVVPVITTTTTTTHTISPSIPLEQVVIPTQTPTTIAYTDASISRVDIFRSAMHRMEASYPNQHSELWRRSKIHLVKHIQALTHSEPVSIMLTAGRKDENTLHCIAIQLAKAFAYATNTSLTQIDGVTMAKQNSDQVKFDIDTQLTNSFIGSQTVAVIHRFEELPPGSTLIFYRYCDHENAAYKDAFLIFTVLLENDDVIPPTLRLSAIEEKVSDHLEAKFLTSDLPTTFNVMDKDKFSGLWSRISHLVLPISTELSIEQRGCFPISFDDVGSNMIIPSTTPTTQPGVTQFVSPTDLLELFQLEPTALFEGAGYVSGVHTDTLYTTPTPTPTIVNAPTASFTSQTQHVADSDEFTTVHVQHVLTTPVLIIEPTVVAETPIVTPTPLTTPAPEQKLKLNSFNLDVDDVEVANEDDDYTGFTHEQYDIYHEIVSEPIEPSTTSIPLQKTPVTEEMICVAPTNAPLNYFDFLTYSDVEKIKVAQQMCKEFVYLPPNTPPHEYSDFLTHYDVDNINSAQKMCAEHDFVVDYNNLYVPYTDRVAFFRNITAFMHTHVPKTSKPTHKPKQQPRPSSPKLSVIEEPIVPQQTSELPITEIPVVAQQNDTASTAFTAANQSSTLPLIEVNDETTANVTIDDTFAVQIINQSTTNTTFLERLTNATHDAIFWTTSTIGNATSKVASTVTPMLPWLENKTLGTNRTALILKNLALSVAGKSFSNSSELHTVINDAILDMDSYIKSLLYDSPYEDTYNYEDNSPVYKTVEYPVHNDTTTDSVTVTSYPVIDAATIDKALHYGTIMRNITQTKNTTQIPRRLPYKSDWLTNEQISEYVLRSYGKTPILVKQNLTELLRVMRAQKPIPAFEDIHNTTDDTPEPELPTIGEFLYESLVKDRTPFPTPNTHSKAPTPQRVEEFERVVRTNLNTMKQEATQLAAFADKNKDMVYQPHSSSLTPNSKRGIGAVDGKMAAITVDDLLVLLGSPYFEEPASLSLPDTVTAIVEATQSYVQRTTFQAALYGLTLYSCVVATPIIVVSVPAFRAGMFNSLKNPNHTVIQQLNHVVDDSVRAVKFLLNGVAFMLVEETQKAKTQLHESTDMYRTGVLRSIAGYNRNQDTLQSPALPDCKCKRLANVTSCERFSAFYTIQRKRMPVDTRAAVCWARCHGVRIKRGPSQCKPIMTNDCDLDCGVLKPGELYVVQAQSGCCAYKHTATYSPYKLNRRVPNVIYVRSLTSYIGKWYYDKYGTTNGLNNLIVNVQPATITTKWTFGIASHTVIAMADETNFTGDLHFFPEHLPNAVPMDLFHINSMSRLSSQVDSTSRFLTMAEVLSIRGASFANDTSCVEHEVIVKPATAKPITTCYEGCRWSQACLLDMHMAGADVTSDLVCMSDPSCTLCATTSIETVCGNATHKPVSNAGVLGFVPIITNYTLANVSTVPYVMVKQCTTQQESPEYTYATLRKMVYTDLLDYHTNCYPIDHLSPDEAHSLLNLLSLRRLYQAADKRIEFKTAHSPLSMYNWLRTGRMASASDSVLTSLVTGHLTVNLYDYAVAVSQLVLGLDPAIASTVPMAAVYSIYKGINRAYDMAHSAFYEYNAPAPPSVDHTIAYKLSFDSLLTDRKLHPAVFTSVNSSMYTRFDSQIHPSNLLVVTQTAADDDAVLAIARCLSRSRRNRTLVVDISEYDDTEDAKQRLDILLKSYLVNDHGVVYFRNYHLINVNIAIIINAYMDLATSQHPTIYMVMAMHIPDVPPHTTSPIVGQLVRDALEMRLLPNWNQDAFTGFWFRTSHTTLSL